MTQRFSTTVNYADHDPWAKRADVLITNPPGHGPTAREVRHLVRVARALPRRNAFILDSTSGRFHPDLLAAALATVLRRHRRPVIVLMGAMWEPDGGVQGVAQRAIVRAADRSIDLYAVQSSAELRLFPQTWGVAPEKLRFVPYFATIREAELASVEVRDDGYIFAGGDSHREYGPLLEAARAFPDRTFVLATRRLEHRPHAANVQVAPMARAGFISALAGAKAVVVPLRADLRRAAGQQTYLNAMLLGKPTIVRDGPGVRDHIEDGGTGIVVDGTPASYQNALASVIDPANAETISRLTRAASADVRTRFTFANHADAVLGVLDEAMARRRDGGCRAHRAAD